MTMNHPEPDHASSRPRQRASPKGERRRQAIIDSAFRFFSRGGFHSASLADIAADVGMSQAGLLHHFPSKADLLLAVLQERDNRERIRTREQEAHGVDRLTSFLEILRENAKEPAITQLFTHMSAESVDPDHPAHDWFVARYRRGVEELAEGLGHSFDADQLPPGLDLETIARWVVAMADGLRLQWQLGEGEVDRMAALERFAGLLWRVLPTRAGAQPLDDDDDTQAEAQ